MFYGKMMGSMKEYEEEASMLARGENDVSYWEGTIKGYRDAVIKLLEFERMEEETTYSAWLYRGDEWWECVRCNKLQPCQSPYCPECGAEMISDE